MLGDSVSKNNGQGEKEKGRKKGRKNELINEEMKRKMNRDKREMAKRENVGNAHCPFLCGSAERRRGTACHFRVVGIKSIVDFFFYNETAKSDKTLIAGGFQSRGEISHPLLFFVFGADVTGAVKVRMTVCLLS